MKKTASASYKTAKVAKGISLTDQFFSTQTLHKRRIKRLSPHDSVVPSRPNPQNDRAQRKQGVTIDRRPQNILSGAYNALELLPSDWLVEAAKLSVKLQCLSKCRPSHNLLGSGEDHVR